MDDVDGDCECAGDDGLVAVMKFGAFADEALDMLVATQTVAPLNFKDLTDVLRKGASPLIAGRDLEFFLSMALATAVIRLAAEKKAAES